MMGVYIDETAHVSEKAKIGDGTKIWINVQVREDAEIGSVIESAGADLMTAGVTVTEDEEPLITTAIVFYLRAYFNFEERGERYERDYEKLKALLSHNYDESGDA